MLKVFAITSDKDRVLTEGCGSCPRWCKLRWSLSNTKIMTVFLARSRYQVLSDRLLFLPAYLQMSDHP